MLQCNVKFAKCEVRSDDVTLGRDETISYSLRWNSIQTSTVYVSGWVANFGDSLLFENHDWIMNRWFVKYLISRERVSLERNGINQLGSIEVGDREIVPHPTNCE